MNQVATAPRPQKRQQEPQRKSIIATMAAIYDMEPVQFERTVRAQCSPTPKRGEQAQPLTPEQFAAFLLVARKYDLDPITREIFAYPKRGGGVVPIVSIDGWINLINSHPACDGFEFEYAYDSDGRLYSCKCIMYRKDRAHPTTVTEFLSECWRDTEPWKMEHRMLRHKALMQCGRYAFGFAGIWDEEEGQRIVEAEAAQAPRPPRPGDQTAAERIRPAPLQDANRESPIIDGEIVEAGDDETEIGGVDADRHPDSNYAFFDQLRERLAEGNDAATIEEIWAALDPAERFKDSPDDLDLCERIKARRLKQLGKED